MGYFWRRTVYLHSSLHSDSFEWFAVLSEDTFLTFFLFQNEYSHCIKILLLLSSTSHHRVTQFSTLNPAGEKKVNDLSACIN